MVKYSLIIAALLGASLTTVDAIRVHQADVQDQMLVQLQKKEEKLPADEDHVKVKEATPGKSSAEKPAEEGESQEDAKDAKQKNLIAEIQASGDTASQKFDAMHEHWGARDKAKKDLADQLAKTPKCTRKKVPADEKPEDGHDSADKAEISQAEAEANNCATMEKKKEDDEKNMLDGEAWTSGMPEKYLQPKTSLFA